MRATAILVLTCLALVVAALAPSIAGAALFTQCPPVDRDAGCQFLITVTNSGVQVAEDATQGPYESSDDSLIGIVDASSKAVSAIPLSAENSLFGFEFDGLCSPGAEPVAPGCVAMPKNGSGNETGKAGEKCPPATEACGFPPPPGEPAGVTFPSGAAANGFAANGDAVSGYEGPTSWFSDVAANASGGVVDFSPPLAPGASTYFSLESPPAGKTIAVGTASTLTTTLSGGGQSGPSISVVAGTPVLDAAAVGGPGGAGAGGTVTYKVFEDPACTQLAAEAGTEQVTAGAGAPSQPALLAPGRYYWQASYSGDVEDQASASACGGEVLTVAKRFVDLGLPMQARKQCFGKRRFTAHPRAPRHVRFVKVEVFIAGILEFAGRPVGRHATIDLRGLPKGTFEVTMIAESSTGQTYGDTRTFKTCVPKARRHK